tara:strand:+ start:2104 stop:4215 length:2112 start_codon:yes stop_codon:yes gene_type:complete
VLKEQIIESSEFGISLSTGKIARQAGGAVFVKMGGTVVFGSACNASSPREGLDFFPLTCDYREKMYASGKIPGGFLKREGRPSTKETLVSRLIDRPIRPLFPDKYRNETQIMVQVIAYDGKNQADVLGILAASAALSLSTSPFLGPIGAVRVGYIDGELVCNPTREQMDDSSLDLVVAGTRKAITMVESEADNLSEDLYLDALAFAHEKIKSQCDLVDQLVEIAGKDKLAFEAPEIDESLMKELSELYRNDFRNSFDLSNKKEREAKAVELKEVIHEKLAQRYEEDEALKAVVKEYLHDIEYEVIRNMIVKEKKRIDGRKVDELRSIEAEVDIFDHLHGSSLFTRGETQALGVLTLGGGDDEQYIDGLDETAKTNFMLHYNFPPFSVGECGRAGFTSRREIGHGELASKAIRAILPTKEEFPYTIRLVSEIMESNGSSSMATVCASSMALMAGGVPTKAPVAGIAMGLFMQGEDYSVLTDIQGAEDHYGDMDFKVAGTTEGVCALQMDIKIEGITIEIMRTALTQAKKARLEILDSMEKAINESREQISEFAPRILITEIPKDKIGDVIGPGGKVIRGICEEFGVKVEVEEKADGSGGTVKVLSTDGPSGEEALNYVINLVAEPEVGKVYSSKVMRITDFGAFVEFMPGREGLLHISKISKKGRLNSVTDILSEGDLISVKLTEKDRMGRYNLSARDVEENDF